MRCEAVVRCEAGVSEWEVWSHRQYARWQLSVYQGPAISLVGSLELQFYRVLELQPSAHLR